MVKFKGSKYAKVSQNRTKLLRNAIRPLRIDFFCDTFISNMSHCDTFLSHFFKIFQFFKKYNFKSVTNVTYFDLMFPISATVSINSITCSSHIMANFTCFFIMIFSCRFFSWQFSSSLHLHC